jgi:hypothetical protein
MVRGDWVPHEAAHLPCRRMVLSGLTFSGDDGLLLRSANLKPKEK